MLGVAAVLGQANAVTKHPPFELAPTLKGVCGYLFSKPLFQVAANGKRCKKHTCGVAGCSIGKGSRATYCDMHAANGGSSSAPSNGSAVSGGAGGGVAVASIRGQ